MPAEGIAEKANTLRGTVRQVEIILEIEIFDLNLSEGNEVKAFFGIGDSFKSFVKGDRTVDWKLIPECEVEGKVFQAAAERPSRRKCHYPPKTIDISECEKRQPHCDLSCPRLETPGCIKIETKRQHVAYSYDDGKRAWNRKTAVEDKKGKWPDKVKIRQRQANLEPWPTEELLARILYYPKSKESKYNEEKKKEVSALMNKIMVLQKDGEIEYVVDRFVSL